MSTRRVFQAHPLVVAAAFGLLGPGALASEDDDGTADCADCGADPVRPQPTSASARPRPHGPRSSLLPTGSEAIEWQPGPAPSADEFHRVELEWLKQG